MDELGDEHLSLCEFHEYGRLMFRIGSHVSISGGISTAVDRVLDLGGNCGQIFVGSPQGWTVSDVDEDTAAAFQDATTEHDVGPWIVHGTYLINLATPKDDLGDESLTCVQQELTATATLDIPYYVFHPGSHTGAGVETGLANVATRLSDLDIPDEVTLLLENTAGKGTTVGQRFEHLAAIVEQSVYEYSQIGICLDTCHLLAAGYDLTSADGLDEMIEALDTSIGVENVQYLHLNDSKHPLDSEKDEHEHIGQGEIGNDGFERFINHDQLYDIPMVVETPENEKGGEWNIQKVKDLRDR